MNMRTASVTGGLVGDGLFLLLSYPCSREGTVFFKELTFFFSLPPLCCLEQHQKGLTCLLLYL